MQKKLHVFGSGKCKLWAPARISSAEETDPFCSTIAQPLFGEPSYTLRSHAVSIVGNSSQVYPLASCQSLPIGIASSLARKQKTHTSKYNECVRVRAKPCKYFVHNYFLMNLYIYIYVYLPGGQSCFRHHVILILSNLGFQLAAETPLHAPLQDPWSLPEQNFFHEFTWLCDPSINLSNPFSNRKTACGILVGTEEQNLWSALQVASQESLVTSRTSLSSIFGLKNPPKQRPFPTKKSGPC